MFSLFFQILTFGWVAIVAVGAGFLWGLRKRIRRPARIGCILAALAYAAVLCSFFAVPILAHLLLGSCREPAGQIAINANIAFAMISTTLAALGIGMMLASLWRANLKFLASCSLVAAGLTMAVFVYLVVFGIGFSASGCYL